MLLFSTRHRLSEYVRWYMRENHIADNTLGVISVLQILGLLNEKKAKELVIKDVLKEYEKDTDAV